MDKVVDMIPSAVSVASVTLEPGYDQSGIAVVGVPARSPWPTSPPHPLEAAVTAVSPVSPELAEALLVGAAAVTPTVTPPEAALVVPVWEDVVLPS